MTDAEKELRRLAQAATPGPWDHDGFVEPEKVRSAEGTVARTAVLGDWDNGTPQQEKDADFIAAANPTAVLALLERIEALEKELEEAESRNEGLYDRNSELKERLKELGP